MGTETKIKICGIKDLPTVKVCRDLKVDYIGLNLSPNSPRSISEDLIPELLKDRNSPGFPQVVFLFYDNSPIDIQKIVLKHKPDLIQLVEGDPKPIADVWNHHSKLGNLLPSFRIQERIEDETYLLPHLPFVILDSFKKDFGGGTGHTFPWEYVENIKRPFLLAGGLTPENVQQALSQLHPFGIDVASGVETDGKKDPNKIKALVKNVRGT